MTKFGVVTTSIFTKITAVFTLTHKNVHHSHTPNRKCQLTIRSTGHSKIVSSEYGNDCIITLLAPTICKWLPDYWKVCVPLASNVQRLQLDFSKKMYRKKWVCNNSLRIKNPSSSKCDTIFNHKVDIWWE